MTTAMRKNWVKAGAVVCMVFTVMGATAKADPTYVLSNGAATAIFEVGGVNATGPASGDPGQTSWKLVEPDHLALQWFFFRIGDDPTALVTDRMTGLELVSHSDLDLGTGFGHILNLEYDDVLKGRFTITMSFTLVGDPGGTFTTIDEQITITNTSAQSLDFSFFEVLDFNLDGTSGGDVLRFPSDNTLEQADGLFASSEVVSTSANPPSRYEGGEISSILTKLTNSDNLGDSPPLNSSLAPTDAGAAFQWDWTLPAGGSEQISKLKRIEQIVIPTPVALWGGLGLLALVGWVRKWRQSS